MSKPNHFLFLFKMLFLAFSLTAVLLLLLAFLLFKFKWGTDLTTYGVYAIYLLACLLPAFLTGKKMRSRRLLWGLAIGALYFVLFFLVSWLLHAGLFRETERIFLVLGLCLAGGVAGGVLS
ncbi:MAG: TIGR04086 family membrane protein [Lachnospiraceae bacterium]|nr:TIGR04086 family membrane protein [Lachnospiraceae bacterium]